MIKGVNLGNWLVLEKWMGPQLFAGTGAEDETQLCRELDDVTKQELFRAHRSSFITERDFAYLAEHGFDMVRIPVPFFIFGGYEPYVGCIEYLDRALDWAETHDLQVLIDLHTVPDGQNGFDNGGICGVCKWHKNPWTCRVRADRSRATCPPLPGPPGPLGHRSAQRAGFPGAVGHLRYSEALSAA
jgi:glucan 1,3-beta-glucosidase